MIKRLVRGLIICLLTGGVLISFLTNESSSRVSGTPHDLTFATGDPKYGYDSDEPCVYCHTPHQGTATQAPLWNKSVPAGPFTMYDSTVSPTFDMGPPSIAAPSTLCLSCHNGSSAMNVVYNTPGPGSTGVIGNTINGGYDQLEDVWYTGSPWGIVKNITESAANNLSNDHPISFTYVPGSDNENNGFPPRTVISGKGFIVGPSSTNYPLYGAVTDRFECATCHSVHDTANYGNKGTAQVYFLRTSNQGSGLCLDCHTLK